MSRKHAGCPWFSPWSYPASGSSGIYTNGQFVDWLATLGSGTAFQTFTAYGSFGVQPLNILFNNLPIDGVNFNIYTAASVSVDGSTTYNCK